MRVMRAKIKVVATALFLSLGISDGAMAADVTNKDGQDAVLMIVEGESRQEIAIPAGATQAICPSGCFLTTPSGDRLALEGGENVEIVNGSALVK